MGEGEWIGSLQTWIRRKLSEFCFKILTQKTIFVLGDKPRRVTSELTTLLVFFDKPHSGSLCVPADNTLKQWCCLL